MNKVSFKGYSNILSVCNIPVNGFKTTYITMKLDDEGEEKDLTKYKQIRAELGYPKELKNEEILTLTYVTDGTTENFYIGEKGISLGDQLIYIRENFVPRFLSNQEYNKMEALHLKIYTFLANLTKRLSNENFENEDNNIKNVIQDIFNNLTKIRKGIFPIFDSQDAFKLTLIGTLKQDKFQKTAWKLNRKIVETMTEFFR